MANNKTEDIQCECKDTFEDGTCKNCNGTGFVKGKEISKTQNQPATKALVVTNVSLEKDSDSGSGTETDTNDELVEEYSESDWKPKKTQQGRVTSACDDKPSPSSPTT